MLRFNRDLLHWSEFPITLVYFVVILVVALFIKGKYEEEKPEYRYFLKGVLIKALGAFIFASVFLLHYGGGDTVYYFEGAGTLINILFNDPYEYFKIMASSHEFDSDLMYVRSLITYAKAAEEWLTVKIVSIINVFSFNRFWTATLLTSMLSFFGSWKLFQTILFFFPKREKEAFWSIFLLPSVFFWGAGILKDTFAFIAMGLFAYSFVKVFFQYRFHIKYIITIIITILFFFEVKVYVFIAFLPSLLLGWIAYNRQKIKSRFIRTIITPFVFIVGISLAFVFVNKILTENAKYNAKGLEQRAKGFHQWHSVVGGSSYSLGEIEYTPLGILKKAPEALSVTFFQPFPNKVTNVMTALGSLEGSTLLVLFILMMIRMRFRWIGISFKNPFLLTALTFSIILGFIVGFTSYNFGALARYKIPVMPFFAFILLHFNALYREEKRKKQLETED